ncbi:MAG: MBL fold metallo-hydrolase [Bdellovibrionales bacterium]|nr:MBL fold metallo-hydrolase [Bdellovibrionales bacterium]
MRVRLWGVRGSLPAPVTPERLRLRLEEVLAQFERLKDQNLPITARQFIETLPTHLTGGYGGNTSCAEVTHGSTRLLIDSGSGLRVFSDLIMKTEPQCNEFHIYFTHFHWDHLIGLPFFAPLYMKGRTIHCYAVHDDLEESLRSVFRKPTFPVPYEVVQKQIRIHKLKPREKARIGELEITPYQLDHPDPCWGVRVEGGGRSLAWAVDTECTRITREELGPDVGLYRDADLMVFDAQYSFGEALEKINWGHSSGPTGIDIALREQVKLALFVHHDPSSDCEAIGQAEDQTRQYFDQLLKARRQSGLKTSDLVWRFAREGEIIQL